MASQSPSFEKLIERAKSFPPLRLAVVSAAQGLVLDTVREATSLGLIEPYFIGDPVAIRSLADEAEMEIDQTSIIVSMSEEDQAHTGAALVRAELADSVMKGHIHTDTFMRALLDRDRGLRVPGQRVSHAFIVDIPSYPKLLTITDAAVNIAPDMNAKADILRNAIALLNLLGVETPKAAVISAVETVNPVIASTVDAACLAIMAKRGQIRGAIVDGPMAFDNAISSEAALEKGMVSDIAGDIDIALMPDLVSGNILTKNLEYLAGATAAGIVLGLSAPVVLSSRADPPPARLAALALAVLVRQSALHNAPPEHSEEPMSAIHCAAQSETACFPIGA